MSGDRGLEVQQNRTELATTNICLVGTGWDQSTIEHVLGLIHPPRIP